MADEFNININVLVILGITGEPEEIELSSIEAEIVKHCQSVGGAHQLSDFYSKFFRYSRPEIVSAVQNLSAKKILLDKGYGYYELNKSMNCTFIARKESEKLETQETGGIKGAEDRRQTSDAVKKLRLEEQEEGERRSKALQDALDKEIMCRKQVIVSKAKKQLSRKLEEYVTALANLGFFAFKNKRNCKKQIKKLRHDLEHLEESDLVAPELEKLQILAKQCVADYTSRIADYLNARYSVETEITIINPLDFYNCVSGNAEHDNISREILNMLRDGSRSLNELMEGTGVTSRTRVQGLIDRLRKYELVELDLDQSERGCGYKFKLRRRFVEKKTEYWKENAKMKRVQLPVAPKVETAFSGTIVKQDKQANVHTEDAPSSKNKPNCGRKPISKKKRTIIISAFLLLVVLGLFLVFCIVQTNRELYVLKQANVGDYVVWGAYEQDPSQFGKEPIEWLVLAKEEGSVLLISRNILDWQPFLENCPRQGAYISWGESTLRTWLNKNFYNSAFNIAEKIAIEKTIVHTEHYGSPSIVETNDKVFILSRTEAEKYFSSEQGRECDPTAYAQEQGAESYDYEGRPISSTWWLRTPSAQADSFVYFPGDVRNHGTGVGYAYYVFRGKILDDYAGFQQGVRPAIWVHVD